MTECSKCGVSFDVPAHDSYQDLIMDESGEDIWVNVDILICPFCGHENHRRS